MKSKTTLWRFIPLLVLAVALLSITTKSALAYVWTDQADYTPGSLVTISGDNRDGSHYLPGETVQVDVAGPVGRNYGCPGVQADSTGAWVCQFTLDTDPNYAV